MNKTHQLWKRLGIRNVEHLILHRPKVSQTVIAQPKQSCARHSLHVDKIQRNTEESTFTMEERLQDMKWEQLNMLPTEIPLKPLVDKHAIKIKRR